MSPSRRDRLAQPSFVDDRTREIFPDWAARARAAGAHMRLNADRHQDGQRLPPWSWNSP